MAERMRRTQILFAEDEYQQLKETAREEGRSIGSLVREAVAERYLRRPNKRRLAAARRLVKMNLPVADWPEMEEEIVRGALLDE